VIWSPAVVQPVVWAMASSVLGIVGTEHDDDHVPFVFGQGFVLGTVPVW